MRRAFVPSNPWCPTGGWATEPSLDTTRVSFAASSSPTLLGCRNSVKPSPDEEVKMLSLQFLSRSSQKPLNSAHTQRTHPPGIPAKNSPLVQIFPPFLLPNCSCHQRPLLGRNALCTCSGTPILLAVSAKLFPVLQIFPPPSFLARRNPVFASFPMPSSPRPALDGPAKPPGTFAHRPAPFPPLPSPPLSTSLPSRSAGHKILCKKGEKIWVNSTTPAPKRTPGWHCRDARLRPWFLQRGAHIS